MPSIQSSSYYQLPSALTGQQNASQSGRNVNLADLLGAVNPGSATKANNQGNQSYLLNLSDAAKSYLSTLQKNDSVSTNASVSSGSNSFLLNSKQRQKLSEIIASYRDKPVTQSNYEALQKDLDRAGLSPKRLAIRDQLRTLNPTRLFIDSLNGKETGAQPRTFGELTDAQKKQAANYLQSIVKQWQTISTVSDNENA